MPVHFRGESIIHASNQISIQCQFAPLFIANIFFSYTFHHERDSWVWDRWRIWNNSCVKANIANQNMRFSTYILNPVDHTLNSEQGFFEHEIFIEYFIKWKLERNRFLAIMSRVGMINEHRAMQLQNIYFIMLELWVEFLMNFMFQFSMSMVFDSESRT